MNKQKHILIVISIIIVIIAIPLFPFTISKMQDKKLVNHLQVENIAKEQTSLQNSSLSITEKLDLMIGYTKKDKDIILTTTSQSINDKNISNLRTIIEKELKTLYTLNILTYLDFNDTFICDTFFIKKYSNAIEPNKSVTVFQICFINNTEYIEIIIDISTNKILQFHYINKTKQFYELNPDEYTNFLNEYLGLTEKDINKYLNYFQTNFKTVIKES